MIMHYRSYSLFYTDIMGVNKTLTPTKKGKRIFIASPVPDEIASLLDPAIESFADAIKQRVPHDKWHVTMRWIGHLPMLDQRIAELAEPISQTYLPTAHVTHVGIGVNRRQLWAYLDPSQVLNNLHQQLNDRLQELSINIPIAPNFIPHITLANLKSSLPSYGLADHPISQSFTIKNLQIFDSQPTTHGSKYELVGTISLA